MFPPVLYTPSCPIRNVPTERAVDKSNHTAIVVHSATFSYHRIAHDRTVDKRTDGLLRSAVIRVDPATPLSRVCCESTVCDCRDTLVVASVQGATLARRVVDEHAIANGCIAFQVHPATAARRVLAECALF